MLDRKCYLVTNTFGKIRIPKFLLVRLLKYYITDYYHVKIGGTFKFQQKYVRMSTGIDFVGMKSVPLLILKLGNLKDREIFLRLVGIKGDYINIIHSRDSYETVVTFECVDDMIATYINALERIRNYNVVISDIV